MPSSPILADGVKSTAGRVTRNPETGLCVYCVTFTGTRSDGSFTQEFCSDPFTPADTPNPITDDVRDSVITQVNTYMTALD